MRNLQNLLLSAAVGAIGWLFVQVFDLRADVKAIKTMLTGELARAHQPAQPAGNDGRENSSVWR